MRIIILCGLIWLCASQSWSQQQNTDWWVPAKGKGGVKGGGVKGGGESVPTPSPVKPSPVPVTPSGVPVPVPPPTGVPVPPLPTGVPVPPVPVNPSQKPASPSQPQRVEVPIDCELSEWASWTACSSSCQGGTSKRTRGVIAEAENGGSCDFPLEQSRKCNSEVPCSVNCIVSDWGVWSQCSKTCGAGTQTRTRTVVTPASGSGSACPALEESTACNLKSCNVDCVMGDWSSWTKCDALCAGGKQTRTRSILVQPVSEGLPCGNTLETAACNTNPCAVDCEVTEWAAWSKCDKSCGSGYSSRTRGVDTAAAFGGNACPELEQKRACNTQACPVDCTVSTWGLWSTCSVSCGGGSRSRTRVIAVQPQNGGAACPVTSETSDCNTQKCPVDCVLSEWKAWGACSTSCGGGIQKRSRGVITEASEGGAACGSTEESSVCNTQPCPADCVVADWSAWSACDKTCGGGSQQRTRQITFTPRFGGKACPQTQEVQTCNNAPCPVDCVMDVWGDWTVCDKTCGSGVSSRTRTVKVSPLNGGEACLATVESRACNTAPCPIPCVLSTWGEWTVCTKSCGSGLSQRTRTVTTEPDFGAPACDATVEVKSCNTAPCPVDCVMAEWSVFTECSEKCGGGQKVRTRAVVVPSANGGKVCSATNEVVACNTSPCPVDCKISAWGVWSTCDKTCGGGKQSRTRTITTASAFGGQSCPATVEVQECNVSPCPIDCVVAAWSVWSTCDKTCGSGSQSRSRLVTVAAANGGIACPETSATQSCNTQPCPIDCVLDDWSVWGECDVSCGSGRQSRSRRVLTAAANGGKECESTLESQNCNTQGCPVDCIMSEWNSWGNCDKTCGGGSRSRTRYVVVAAANEGRPCGATSESESCNVLPCPIDCVLSKWSAWSECDATCGGGSTSRTRTVVTSPANGGIVCANTQEVTSCNVHPCPIDCIMGQWTGWSDCDKTCGKGLQQRTRRVATAAAFGGKACESGVEVQTCNTAPCPVDCVVADWSAWSACTKSCGTGSQTRTRTITVASDFGGKPCPELTATQSCNIDPCPVDCVLTEWTKWSECDKTCGAGTRTRSRSVVQAALFGGIECGALGQTEVCNTQPCPIDCVMSDWLPWGSCSKTCGGGVRSRTRIVLTQDQFGGKVCPATTATEDCNVDPCPVDCVLSAWSEWTICDVTCGGGIQKRTRTVTVSANFGGKVCEALVDERSCNDQPCPIDCVMSTWASWTECDKTCGGGSQSRTRDILVQTAFGGIVCAETSQTQKCNEQPCPIDCVMSEWASWTACSEKCGGGRTRRTRAITVTPNFGGKPCPDSEQNADCNTQPCPIDCVMSAWSTWSTCTVTCGGGKTVRTRKVVVNSAFGGAECPLSTETKDCNINPCPIDCVMSEWNSWTECTKSCGMGFSTRSRTVSVKPEFGGKACGLSSEWKSCNLQSCPIDCVQSAWSSWTVCDKTCGGGSQSRSRTATTVPQFGGKACGASTETQQCNSNPCPVDCVMSAWGEWAKCDKTCGVGSTSRTRVITTQPLYGGIVCGATVDTQTCNTHPCPVDCVLSEFTKWSECDKSCGTGKRSRSRTVSVSPAFGGAACAATAEVEACNSQPCPIDCVVGEWSAYSVCTKTCGTGQQTRTRKISIQTAFGGKQCPATTETIDCNVQACPIDCVMSEWTTFSVCDRTCGSGRQSRTRSVTVVPQFGGKLCDSTQESQACNTQPCPVDCVMSTFTPWSSCDKTCGSGSQSRTRFVQVEARFGGIACGATSESQVCNTQPCPVDCVLGAWVEWSVCPVTCGGGVQKRTRPITTATNFGGKSCEATAEERICNPQPCPIDCVVTAWTEWSQCSEPCGGGRVTRSRTIKVPASFGGKECPSTYERNDCNTQPCPINCVMSEWGKWSECTKSCGMGFSTRSRDIVVKNQFGGAACGLSAEWKSCNLQPCPIDCVMSDWTVWSACTKSCGTGSTTRTRKITVESQFNGKTCGVTTETVNCNTQPCPIDCILSDWTEFSQCDKTCGGGSQSRTRKITRPAQFGGIACSSELVQSQKCNVQACPIDCQMGVWSEWTQCARTCGLGTQSRSRTITVQSAFGGQPCTATNEVRTCNSQPCPVDCVLSQWGEWTACSKTCGGGSTSRSRTITTATAYGGKECGVTFELKTCNEGACPVDCIMGAWSTWSSCSATCGSGVSFRTRKVEVASAFGGKACSATQESTSCNTQQCPVDCVMGAWSGWSDCNRVCGGGSQTRTRSVTVSSAFGGKVCDATFDSRACNTQPCPVDCVMGDWSKWTPCDKTCGKGVTTRVRNIVVQTQFGGKACETTTESNECNPQQCPQDCVVQTWGAWSQCDKTCGGGVSIRRREVLVPSKYAGRECPQLEEVQKCNEQPCPVDCVLSVWSEWSVCSEICGSGKKTRSRTIVTSPANGGKQCDVSFESQVCNTQPCPVNCQVSDWSQWSECSVSCGGGRQTRTRKVLKNSAFGGAECPAQQETQVCNVNPCPVDCVMSEWGSFGSCSKECGRGVQSRTRIIAAAAQFGGVACGATIESRECNTQDCPVDCVMAPWGSWSECDKTCGGGFAQRTRVVQRPSANGGVPCGATVERQQCNATPCPVNCVMGAWASWSECSKPCGSGVQTRTRSIVTQPIAGGKACEATFETKQCNVDPCIVNCVQSDWSAWTACSTTCGAGVRSRSRTTTVQPSAGGKQCGATVEQEACTLAKCPVDCVMGDFTAWSACSVSCGKGTKTRTRVIITAPNEAGKACTATKEQDVCELKPCPVDCVMSEFGVWSVCDKSCDGGVSRRRRTVVSAAANGGVACGATEESVACNTQKCAVDCVMSSWGTWSACSTTCGAGIQTRSRTVQVASANGGRACEATFETTACNSKPCPVDCSMSGWSEWSPCDKQCGGGQQTRTRNVYQASANGGLPCSATFEQQQCNTQSCASDCVMAAWSEWSQCTTTCGGFGVMTRTRAIVSQPNGGGAPCGPSFEQKACPAQQPCPSGGSKGGGSKGGSVKGGSFGGAVWSGLEENNNKNAVVAVASSPIVIVGLAVALVAVVAIIAVVRRRRSAQVMEEGFYQDF